MHMTSRERRSWTEAEDNLLRSAVQQEDADSHPPTKWRAIAKHIPNRNNKDCRKRWFAKMASPVARGGWSADEDDRLVRAIQNYGTRWSLVAATVGTRNNNQCAKRWSDTLSPDIDRTAWTPEEDAQLLAAVVKHGTLWAKIVKIHFPGRTGLSAKNRYTRLSRTSADPLDDRRHHHTGHQRSSPSPYDAFLANRSLETWQLPSADYSDTMSTSGSSSSSLVDRPSSQTPEQECPRSMDQLEDESSGLQTTSFQLPSYGHSEITEQMTASDTLFWGNSPSTFVLDLLHPQTVQQGLNCQPYEATMNEVAHFVSSNSCPLQTLNEGAQPSRLSDLQFFDHQSSLYPAYNKPCTIGFSHLSQMTYPQPNPHHIYQTNGIRELPPMSDTPLPIITPSFCPSLHSGTPDFSLPVAGPTIRKPAFELHKTLGDDTQDLSMPAQVADTVNPSTWNSSTPCLRIPSPSDANVGFTVEKYFCGHSSGDNQCSRVTVASARHGDQVTVAVAL